MQKTLLFLLLLVLTFLNPRLLMAQISVAVEPGLNLTNLRLHNEKGIREHTKAIANFQLGVRIDIPLTKELHLQPGAFYAKKGFSQKGGWLTSEKSSFSVRVTYVEVPINLLYKPSFAAEKLSLGAGFYVGLGTGGHWESEENILIGDIMLSETRGNVRFKEDFMDGGFGEYLYGKPWDYGTSFLMGYEFLKQVTLLANVRWGIRNLEPKLNNLPTEGKKKNYSLGMGIAYRL